MYGMPQRAATPDSYGHSWVEYVIEPSVFIGTSAVTVRPGIFDSLSMTAAGSVAETPLTRSSLRSSVPDLPNEFAAAETPPVLWMITGIFEPGCAAAFFSRPGAIHVFASLELPPLLAVATSG